MKRGFTLVELLAIIVIIAIIGLIVVPTVNTAIKNSKERAYEAQVAIIEEGAHKWALDHNDLLPEMVDGSSIKLSLTDIIKEGHIKKTDDGKLKNPKESGKNMEGCVVITYSSEYNQYIYEYDENCTM